jgi:hypothetical protein
MKNAPQKLFPKVNFWSGLKLDKAAITSIESKLKNKARNSRWKDKQQLNCQR